MNYAKTYVDKSNVGGVKSKNKIKRDETFFGADRTTTKVKNPEENTKRVQKEYKGSKGTRTVDKTIDRNKGTIDKTITKTNRKTGEITKKKVIKNRKNLKGLLKGAIAKAKKKKDVYSAKPKSAKEVATETIDRMNVGATGGTAMSKGISTGASEVTPMSKSAYGDYRKKQMKEKKNKD